MAEYLQRSAPGRLAGVIVCVLWAAGAQSSSYAEDWTTYQHDAQHRGGSSSSLNPLSLEYSWSAPAGFRRGVIVGNRVFSTRTTTGEVVAFDLDTGAVEWGYIQGIESASSPSYIDGWLVFSADTTQGDRLIVLDADTGNLIYMVNMATRVSTFGTTPALRRNPQTGVVLAFLATHNQVEAFVLRESEGISLWTGSGSFGGHSIPTLAGGSLILAGPGQFYAFNIQTGSRNHFQSGNISGGGGNTAAYDESRNQLYILEYFETSDAFLSAYEVIDNNNIVLLWQHEGLDIWSDNAVALDSEGYVYSIGGGTLTVRDPDTGDTMDSVVGSFANGMAPILTDDYIWTFSASETNIYDRTSLEWVASLPGTRGHSNTPWKSIGALTNTHFLLDNQQSSGGFDVFAATSCQSGDECDDGNACTDDFCDPTDPNADEFGCTHSPTNCDDGNACTADSCDPDSGCVNVDISDECDDGNACTADSCDSAIGCVNEDIGQMLFIKQGACPSPVNPNSNGVIPILLVGDVGFDVNNIDLDSLDLHRCDGASGSATPLADHTEVKDLNHPADEPTACGGCTCNADQSSDGVDDLSLKFRTSTTLAALGLGAGDGVVTLELTGEMLDGTPFCARDCIVVVPPGTGQPNATMQSNVPDTFIEMTPLDLNIDSDGFADFTRTFVEGTTITLTAPITSDGRRFLRWSVNGEMQGFGMRTIEVTVNESRTLKAFYKQRGRVVPELPSEGSGDME